jgi:hypothetical protein
MRDYPEHNNIAVAARKPIRPTKISLRVFIKAIAR